MIRLCQETDHFMESYNSIRYFLISVNRSTNEAIYTDSPELVKSLSMHYFAALRKHCDRGDFYARESRRAHNGN